jgi:N-acetylglucosamine kinase-like BadF-type ATPase
MPPFVLGVDGGGTKTIAILMDRDGAVIGRGQAGPSNRHAVGEATAQVELRRAIEAAMEAAMEAAAVHGSVAAADVQAVCLGMAGVDRPGDAEAVASVVRQTLPAARVIVHNDAVIALVGGVGSLYGVVLIAGTGAIAYGVDAHGRSRRSSGWGHLLGDEGSGYDMGLRALRAVLRAHDGRGPATLLTAQVLGAWNLSQPEDLIGLVYAPGFPRRRIASLLPLVDAAAEAGDAVARQLLISAGHELGEAACAVIRGLGMEQDTFDVALVGGAFQTRHLLREAVDETVRAMAPRAVLLSPRHEPAMGAALLALRAAGW